MKIKKIIKTLLLVFISVFAIWFNFNQTNANNEYKYTNLNVIGDIKIDWTIDVTEEFTADFFVSKHWIIRNIPLNYSVDWYPFHIEVSNIDVKWKKFTTSKSNWSIDIKIWDANKTVIWTQEYSISYETYWLIRNFAWKWYSELYRNVVWNEFDTSFDKVKVELILPKVYTWFTSWDFLIAADWVSNRLKDFEWTLDWSQGDKIILTYDKILSAYKWITLSVKFPNDYFEYDYEKQNSLVWNTSKSIKSSNDYFEYDHEKQNNLVWDTSNKLEQDYQKLLSSSKLLIWLDSHISNYKVVLVILLIIVIATNVLIITLIIKIIKYIVKPILKKIKFYYNSHSGQLKWRFAKKFPTIVQYNPPVWLTPAEVWLLLHRWAKKKDLISLIFYYVSKWNLKIEKDDTIKILLEQSMSSITNECGDSSFIIDIISAINHKWNLNMYTYIENINNRWIKIWWLKRNKIEITKKILGCIWFVYFVLFIVSIFTFFSEKWIVIFFYTWLSFWICIILTGIFGVIWSKLMVTEKWAELISQILWFRKFVANCDENKLKTLLKKDPLYVDKILPYAIVFWLEHELLDKMQSVAKECNISSSRYCWDSHITSSISDTISNTISHFDSFTSNYNPSSSSSSGGFDSWSSFSSSDSWWSSWWWWGWWGWRSW